MTEPYQIEKAIAEYIDVLHDQGGVASRTALILRGSDGRFVRRVPA